MSGQQVGYLRVSTLLQNTARPTIQPRKKGGLTKPGYKMVTWKPESKKPDLASWAKCLILLVPLTGIELVTFALRMRCSTI